MSSDTSTLSSHSVVLSWLKDHTDSPFPMKDFTKAISHDLQGSHGLLQHIARIRPFWRHGRPSTHRRRHQLYVGNLRPLLAKHLKRVERLIAFVDSEVQVFCSRPSRLSHSDKSVTSDLLKQLRVALQHLLNQIDSSSNDQPPPSVQPKPDRVSEQQGQATRDRSTTRNTPPAKEKPKKRVRFVTGAIQAQQISLIKPQQAPAIVTQCRHIRCTCDRTYCQCNDKTPSPISRVDSAMSIR